jgi:hypothetical protein
MRSRLRVSRRLALEDHEDAEVLVSGEAMLGAGLDEDRRALFHGNLLAFDLEGARALENDVQLVVVGGGRCRSGSGATRL